METEIFTCKYFKFGRNTTGLSQSHLRNFLACSIIERMMSFFSNSQPRLGTRKINGGRKFSEIKVQKT